MVNNDAVVRTNYYKYFHPKVMVMLRVVVLMMLSALNGNGFDACVLNVKYIWSYISTLLQECLVQNGVLNRAVSAATFLF